MAGLQDFHHAAEKPDKTQRVATWVAIAVVLGAVTFYVVETEVLNPQPQQAGHSYPRGL
jgi:hypothetical protein